MTTQLLSQIRLALMTHVGKYEAEYKRTVIDTYVYLNSKCPNLKDIYSFAFKLEHGYNDYGYWKFTVEPNCSVIYAKGKESSCLPSSCLGYRIDAIKLDRNSKKYAEEVVTAFASKLTAKLECVTNVTVHHLDGADMRITAERDGKKIHIEQRCVLKVSPKGKLFNQFPALIYVDNKFYAEAAYKKLFSNE